MALLSSEPFRHPPPVVHRIYLTGFMGAGKSTVGALLAQKLAWRFFDLDQLIEHKTRQSVAMVFAAHGEGYFRRLEAEALRELQGEMTAVISLGGGAIETEEVRALLAGDLAGTVIFLEAPLHRLIDRCEAQDGGVSRPLLNNPPLLQARYEKRVIHYRSAHLTVATQDLKPEEVAAAIVNYLAALQAWK